MSSALLSVLVSTQDDGKWWKNSYFAVHSRYWLIAKYFASPTNELVLFLGIRDTIELLKWCFCRPGKKNSCSIIFFSAFDASPMKAPSFFSTGLKSKSTPPNNGCVHANRSDSPAQRRGRQVWVMTAQKILINGGRKSTLSSSQVFSRYGIIKFWNREQTGFLFLEEGWLVIPFPL